MRATYARYGNSLWQLLRFGIVGGLGVLVNTIAVVAATKVLPLVWQGAGIAAGEGVWWPIPGSDFNVRWYHVMAAVAFFIANVFNFQLNRWWTFKSSRAAGWFREYWPFLTVGLVAFGFGQLILTALMNQDSPIALPRDVFDSSSGFRNPFFWANLIMIVCTIPVSFLLNKFWTFRAVRGLRRAEHPDHPDDVGVDMGAES